MKKMRYIFTGLAGALFLALFPACNEGNPGSGWTPALTGRYLSTETGALSFGADTQLEQTFVVDATTTPWQIAGMMEWLTLSPATGSDRSTVKAVAAVNPSGDNSRTCLLTLSSKAEDFPYHTTIQATQSYAQPYIRPSETSLSFSGSASTATVSIASNIVWAAFSDQHWLEVEVSEDASSIRLSAAENATDKARSATVTLQGKVTAVLTVVQAVARMEGGGATLTFEQNGGTYQLSIQSEASWAAATEQTWIQIDPAQGVAGTTAVLVSAAPNASENDRNGLVVFSIGGSKRIEVAVVQKGIYVETAETSIAFEADGGTHSLQVLSNASWTLRSKPDWISLSEENGTGEKPLQVTAAENPEIEGRSGSLVLGVSGGTRTAAVSVSQSGRRFTPEAFSLLQFSDREGTDTLRFSTDASWAVYANEEWISLAPMQGKGDGKVVVKVTENTTDDKRTGSISVQVGSTEKTAVVVQDGKFFTVTTGGEAAIPSTGGSHTLSFQTNEAWTLQTGSSWISGTPKEGIGDASVVLTAGDHPSLRPRTDTSYIRPENLQPIRIITTQAARFLRADHTALAFFAKGGVSETVVVETDATYTISTQETWLTVSRQGKTFTVAAASYDGKEQREGTVSLTMTGLNQGESYCLELPVVQYAEGAFFTIRPFSEEENWNLAGGTDATLTVVGYGTDENWNPQNSSTDMNGHEYVDLGLPSGLLWATCNVGASVPEDYGDYFAWGETSPKTVFAWFNLKYCLDPSGNKFSKYVANSSYGTVDNKTVLEPEDDAAQVNWGGSWRMPTKAEFQELIDKCTWTWTTMNGKNGYKVVSKVNGSSVFFPAAGYRDGTSLYDAGSLGGYWSSSLYESISNDAWVLNGNSGFRSVSHYYRYYGLSVRPVCH